MSDTVFANDRKKRERKRERERERKSGAKNPECSCQIFPLLLAVFSFSLVIALNGPPRRGLPGRFRLRDRIHRRYDAFPGSVRGKGAFRIPNIRGIHHPATLKHFDRIRGHSSRDTLEFSGTRFANRRSLFVDAVPCTERVKECHGD